MSAGFSSTSTEPPAPSAQRPAHEASHAARRPASQRPSAARTTHSTAMLWAARSGSRRSAQRAGWSSSRSRPSRSSNPASRPASPSWLGEPRSRRASSATSATSISARVGRELVLAPRHVYLGGIPGATGQQAGCARHARNGSAEAGGPTREARPAGPTRIGCPLSGAPSQALGLGIRGRAAFARRAHGRRGVPGGAARVRLARARAAGAARRGGAPRAARRRTGVAAGDRLQRALRPRAAHLWTLLQRHRAGIPGPVRPPARCGPAPAYRGRARGGTRLGDLVRRRGDPVRRAARASSAASRPTSATATPVS